MGGEEWDKSYRCVGRGEGALGLAVVYIRISRRVITWSVQGFRSRRRGRSDDWWWVRHFHRPSRSFLTGKGIQRTDKILENVHFRVAEDDRVGYFPKTLGVLLGGFASTHDSWVWVERRLVGWNDYKVY